MAAQRQNGRHTNVGALKRAHTCQQFQSNGGKAPHNRAQPFPGLAISAVSWTNLATGKGGRSNKMAGAEGSRGPRLNMHPKKRTREYFCMLQSIPSPCLNIAGSRRSKASRNARKKKGRDEKPARLACSQNPARHTRPAVSTRSKEEKTRYRHLLVGRVASCAAQWYSTSTRVRTLTTTP